MAEVSTVNRIDRKKIREKIRIDPIENFLNQILQFCIYAVKALYIFISIFIDRAEKQGWIESCMNFIFNVSFRFIFV